MRRFYSEQDTYPRNPYAEAKASYQTALGAEKPYWFFSNKGKGRQVDNSTGDPYAEAKEWQQRVAS